jgi:hypothetical protein
VRALAIDHGASVARPAFVVRARDAATRQRLHTGGGDGESTPLALVVRRRSGLREELDLLEVTGDVACGLSVATGALPLESRSCHAIFALLPAPEPHEGPDPQALALLDGLAGLVASWPVRPAIAVVVSKVDLLAPDERDVDPRALLTAHGYGAGLTGLELEASALECFAASAIGDGDPEAPRPEGVAEPVLWALARARAQRRWTRIRRRVLQAVVLAALAVAGAGLDTLCWLRSVAPPALNHPTALLDAAARASAYGRRPWALHAADARRAAAAWTATADAALWAQVEEATSGADDDAALLALDAYLAALPGGAQAERARLLADERRTARLLRLADRMELDGLLQLVTAELDRLHGEAARLRVEALRANVSARVEARDLDAVADEIEGARARGELQRGVEAIERFLASHPRAAAGERLRATREGLLAELDARAWARFVESLARVEVPLERLSALRRHLAAHPRTSTTVAARDLLASLEVEADDAAYAEAAAVRAPTASDAAAWREALERYLTEWPHGRHGAAARALLTEVVALCPVFERVAARDPEGVLAAAARARADARVTADLLDGLGRRWSVVRVTVLVRTAHVRGSYWEVFSQPDPYVALRVLGVTQRTGVAADERDPVYDATFTLVARADASVRLELCDDEIFGEELVDAATLHTVAALDGTIRLGGSEVTLSLLSLEPAGP